MSDITLTAGVRQNLLSLQKTADLMATTQNRLATGKKVNSALDNPVSFFTSQSLGDRANDLSSLLDSISNATQTLQAANNGLTSLTKLVQSAQAIAQQAQTSAGTTATVHGTVAGLTTSSATTFNSTTDTITVSDGTTTATFTAALSSTAGALITAINNTASLKVKASLTDDGRVQLQATDASTVTVGGLASAAEKAQLGLVDGATTGALNSTRTSLATQFELDPYADRSTRRRLGLQRRQSARRRQSQGRVQRKGHRPLSRSRASSSIPLVSVLPRLPTSSRPTATSTLLSPT